MNQEITFIIVFWVHFILIIIFNRVLPVIKAKKTGSMLSPDKAAIKNEGIPLFLFRVISGLFVAASIVIYSFFPSLNTHLKLSLPVGIRWSGVIIASLSLIFWIYSQDILNRNWSANLMIQKEHTLITKGPYRFMRNPIYTAMIFWSAGLVLYSAHIFFLVFTILVIVWIPARIAKEEKMMIDHFGEEYLVYMKTTGRYLPKFLPH